MADVLVLYASTHGHTAKVAARIADRLRAEGVDEVDVRDVAADAGTLDPGAYDAVVAGGSLHVGHHQGGLLDWVKPHRAALADRPSAFPDGVDTGPLGRHRRGAAVPRVQRFTRTLVRLMMRRGGHPTDTSQDYDYTDRDAVERFGREFAALVAKTSR